MELLPRWQVSWRAQGGLFQEKRGVSWLFRPMVGENKFVKTDCKECGKKNEKRGKELMRVARCLVYQSEGGHMRFYIHFSLHLSYCFFELEHGRRAFRRDIAIEVLVAARVHLRLYLVFVSPL